MRASQLLTKKFDFEVSEVPTSFSLFWQASKKRPNVDEKGPKWTISAVWRPVALLQLPGEVCFDLHMRIYTYKTTIMYAFIRIYTYKTTIIYAFIRIYTYKTTIIYAFIRIYTYKTTIIHAFARIYTCIYV